MFNGSWGGGVRQQPGHASPAAAAPARRHGAAGPGAGGPRARRRRGDLRRRERQGRHERGLHPHRLLPAVRVRDEHAPDGARPPQGAPQGRAQGARARRARARRLVARLPDPVVRYERIGAAAVVTIDRTQRLPRIVGLGRALDLILTGRLVPAPEALALGLITEVVARGAHLERALSLAEGLAAFPQETMLADRRAVHDGLGLPLADGLAVEARNAEPTFAAAAAGAARFAAGEGRGGASAGA